MSVNKKNGHPAWFRTHKLLSIVGLIILLSAGIWVWQAYQKHQNKLAFQQARSAIDQVYADIVSKVGTPADSKSINECSRPNQEFTQGPLSCAVGTSFIYAVADRNEATQKYKEIQNVIKSRPDLFETVSPLSSEITDEFVVNTIYHSAYDKLKSLSNMDCSAKYIYDTPEETFLRISPAEGKPLQINIDCSDWARQPLYPLSRG